MKSSTTTFVALLIATTASAQITVTHVAAGNGVSCTATYSGRQPVIDSVPANTDLMPSKSLSAVSATSARWTAAVSNTPAAVTTRYTFTTSGRYSSFSSRGTGSMAGSTLLTIQSVRPTAAILRLTWTPLPSNSFSTGSCSADIGNDQQLDFRGSSTVAATMDFPATLNSSGTEILLTMNGRSSGSNTSRISSFRGTFTVTVLPPETCLFFKTGTPCGPELNASNGFEDRITISASKGDANGPGMLVLGFTRTNQPLLGTNCLLLVNPLRTVPIRFDANGSFSFTAPLPNQRPIAFPLQVGSLATKIATSNALTIICP